MSDENQHLCEELNKENESNKGSKTVEINKQINKWYLEITPSVGNSQYCSIKSCPYCNHKFD